MLDLLSLVGSGGANRAMEAELKRLSPRALGRFSEKPQRMTPQVLRYPYDADLAWLAGRYLRTPSRVLRDFAESTAERLEPLYDDFLAQLTAHPGFADLGGRSFSVEARDRDDFPASTLQVRGTAKNAIIEASTALGRPMRLDPESPELSFRVWAGSRSDDRYILSLDLAGRSLHERGYRIEAGEAPLRETVAAQLLMLARWDSRSEMLFDPLAGSGTLAIEGALMAHGAPLWMRAGDPDLDRIPGLAEKGAGKRLFPGAKPQVIASDHASEMVAIMDRNVKRAGVQNDVFLLNKDFRELTPHELKQRLTREAPPSWSRPFTLEKGLIVANPPYGERLSEDPEPLYRELGSWFRHFGPGWRAAFIVGHDGFEAAFGMPARVKKPLNNGPIKAWFLLYDRKA